MPFGLKPAPSKFQKFINTMLSDLIKTGDIVAYLDDFLVATDLRTSHKSIKMDI